MHFGRVIIAISAALAILAASARADGPHWHVPNPDGDETSPGDDKKKPEKDGIDKIRGMAPMQPDHNPGNFLEMDAACSAYYRTHCMLFPAKGQRELYEQIMLRCAQAMREVDTYCPCPDSFPLWKTEETRARMVEYAKATWIKSSRLKPELAARCAEICVECYVDTVRFADDARARRLPNDVKAFFDLNKQQGEILQKLQNENDPAKRAKLEMEWRRSNGVTRSHDVARVYHSFKMLTGDIPMMVDEAQARMVLALMQMGPIVLPPLRNATRHANVTVKTAATNLIAMLEKNLAQVNMSNVVLHLRQWAQAPNSNAGRASAQALKAMDEAAVPILVQIAGQDTLELKKEAVAQLQAITGRPFGGDMELWKAYAASLRPRAAEKKPDAPPDAGEVGPDDEIVIGKRQRKKGEPPGPPVGDE